MRPVQLGDPVSIMGSASSGTVSWEEGCRIAALWALGDLEATTRTGGHLASPNIVSGNLVFGFQDTSPYPVAIPETVEAFDFAEIPMFRDEWCSVMNIAFNPIIRSERHDIGRPSSFDDLLATVKCIVWGVKIV